MGQNNRQRRAAKQRKRAQRRPGRSTPPGSGPFGIDEEVFGAGAASLFLGRALRILARGGEPKFDLLDFQRCAERHQQAAVDEQFAAAARGSIGAGWTPLDLHEAVRRKTVSTAITHLLDAVAEATAQHPAHLIHPQWAAQLEQVGASVRQTGGLSPAFEWGRRAGLDWPAALEHLLAVLMTLNALPVLEPVLPAPGSRGAGAASDAGIDAKILRRVRGLLAKAESTEHPEEAESLTSKAQELMTRYSLERAVAEAARPAAPEPVCRRLWLESPYVDAKSILVVAVAEANNCRAVQSTGLGCVTVVGHATDLDVTELLVTSLLVQATRAMTLAGKQTTRHGTSRTRSFRQSFLIAYADRIGERLSSSAHDAQADYDTVGGALVPVLTARRERVDAKLAALYPELVERTVSISNAAGWGAGRAAADLALFDVHGSLTSHAG